MARRGHTTFTPQLVTAAAVTFSEQIRLLTDEGFRPHEIMAGLGYTIEYGHDSLFAAMPLAVAEDDFSLNDNPTGWEHVEGPKASWLISHASRVIVESPYETDATRTSVYPPDRAQDFAADAAAIIRARGNRSTLPGSCRGCGLCLSLGRS